MIILTFNMLYILLLLLLLMMILVCGSSHVFIMKKFVIDGAPKQANDHSQALQVNLQRAYENEYLSEQYGIAAYLYNGNAYEPNKPAEAHDYGQFQVEIIHVIILRVAYGRFGLGFNINRMK